MGVRGAYDFGWESKGETAWRDEGSSKMREVQSETDVGIAASSRNLTQTMQAAASKCHLSDTPENADADEPARAYLPGSRPGPARPGR
jgi:hypothetical protein